MRATDDDLPADPTRVGSAAELAAALSVVRERAGVTVRALHRPTGILPSTLGGYFSGRHLPSAPALRQVLSACGITEPDDLAAWTDALLRARRGRRRASAVCPYRGLESFGREDARWFHGRADLVGVVVDRLRAASAAGQPLVVVGPSGSGKSSLLAAGVLPRLDGPAATLTPGADPLDRLAAAPPDGLLVIDQFEEVFAPGVDRSAARAAAAALVARARTGAPTAVALRADFYAQALRLDPIAAALQEFQVVVPQMTIPQLQEVVTAPAAEAGVDLEPGLVHLLLDDLDQLGVGPSGVLPLLSHALLVTWERSNGTRMTIADYRGTGGVRSAIARSAEEAVAALGQDRVDDVRQLFLRLVHVGAVATGTRRIADRSDLPRSDDGSVREVLDAFVRQRLVVVDGSTVAIAHEALLVAWPRLRRWIESDRAGTVVHHQLSESARQWREHGEDAGALLRGARLAVARERFTDPAHRTDLNELERRFLSASEQEETRRARVEQRRTRRLRRLLAVAVVSLLVIAALGAWSVEQGWELTAERDVAVSRQLAMRADDLRADDPALAAQLAVAAHGIAPTLEARSALMNATAVPVPASLPGPPAVTQTVAAANGVLAVTGGLEPTAQIWRFAPDGRAGSPGSTAAVGWAARGAALTRDAGTLAVGGTGGVAVLDLAAGAPPRTVPLGGATAPAVAITPDARTLLAATSTGVRQWTVAELTELPSPEPTGPLQAVAASPDGRHAAAAGAGGTVLLWEIAGANPVRLPDVGSVGTVYGVAFSPDARLLAAGGDDHVVRLWDVSDPQRPRSLPPLTGPTGWVNSVAFAPDGRSLAAGSADGKAWVWDLATGHATAYPHPTPVTSVAFVDGGTLATGEADGTTRLWTLGGPVRADLGDGVFGLDFDAEGGRLAVGPGKRDNTARLWSVTDGSLAPLGPALQNPRGEQAVSGSAALTPDGRTLAVGRTDGSIRLWDVSDATAAVSLGPPLTGPAALVEHLTTSPDGRLLAASADDHAVHVWDISAPGAPRPLPPLAAATDFVFASAFSPDGRVLAAASADTRTYLWELADPARPALLAALDGPAGYAYSPAFSPDGRLLAVGSADKTIRLWDVSDPAKPVVVGRPLVGPGGYVYSVAFSPDGARLAAAVTDGTVWLWDVAVPADPAPHAVLAGPAEAAYAVAWHPDGRHLVAGSADRSVRVWATDPDDTARRLCAAVGVPLSDEVWQRFVEDLPYEPPCR